MSNWVLKRKSADYVALSKELNVDPLIVRIMLNRGIDTVSSMHSFLYADEKDLYDYSLLNGVTEATNLLKTKVSEHKLIRVVGDYDVDGVCATTILLKGLRKIGAEVDHYIPKRDTDGYGLNLNIIEKAHEEGVDTILTCDNGIAAFEQIELAKSYGMTVVITDHHEIPFDEVAGKRVYKMPDADIVIDPKTIDNKYPFKEICGAVVAYKLMECLLGDEANKKELLEELLQYAALATVADVMDLLDENRIIVKLGLKLMNEKPAFGIKAIIDLNKIKKDITSYVLGFVLGPTINAAGRLSDAEIAVNMLMADDYEEAIKYGTELKALNDERKMVTEKCTDNAIKAIEESDIIGDKIIVVDAGDCNEGVIGIVAGRLKEKYHRPALVVAKHEGVYKGSGRSIEEYHLYDGMNEVQDLFIQFGGHAGAAGFSIEIDKLAELRKRLNENCKLTDEDLSEKFLIDVDMPPEYCDARVMNQLGMLEPFGNGNPSPKFARNDFEIVSARLLGPEKNVGKYSVIDRAGKKSELTLFNLNSELREYLEGKFGKDLTDDLYDKKTVRMPMAIAYYPRWNEFNGNRSIQFVIVDYK